MGEGRVGRWIDGGGVGAAAVSAGGVPGGKSGGWFAKAHTAVDVVWGKAAVSSRREASSVSGGGVGRCLRVGVGQRGDSSGNGALPAPRFHPRVLLGERRHPAFRSGDVIRPDERRSERRGAAEELAFGAGQEPDEAARAVGRDVQRGAGGVAEAAADRVHAPVAAISGAFEGRGEPDLHGGFGLQRGAAQTRQRPACARQPQVGLEVLVV